MFTDMFQRGRKTVVRCSMGGKIANRIMECSEGEIMVNKHNHSKHRIRLRCSYLLAYVKVAIGDSFKTNCKITHLLIPTTFKFQKFMKGRDQGGHILSWGLTGDNLESLEHTLQGMSRVR